MVLRLFVPPGEGQHPIVPKRPEVLGANAALQYSAIGSTLLAVGYTWVARKYPSRFGASPQSTVPTTFLRSSAKLGAAAIIFCSAVNWYYHQSFTSVVIAQAGRKTISPYKLFEKTNQYTADDGAIAGARIGLLAGLSLWRMRLPWWTPINGWLLCWCSSRHHGCAQLPLLHR
ncbi:hypothetical protein BDV96DRAFT_588280 [Lophiotrema nucula]|uniref:Uncharacterized protein n=1 Tax=Lophiotrema nucula TaxID=690887 RepID=A0A6A5YL58_9PLEO|nr:hypothetical protein BDV96DRAFT_588280 [Lophiotrema nucula]